jgi:hypothetical protein
LARFVSADTIVPGASGGVIGPDDAKLTPLTVDFHEPGFVAAVNGENSFTLQKGFWFELGNEDRKEAKYQWGPANPQVLNRYAYVLNNPLRYTDPTGHTAYLSHQDAAALEAYLLHFADLLESGKGASQWVGDLAQSCQDAGCNPLLTNFLQLASAILSEPIRGSHKIVAFLRDLGHMIGGMNNAYGVAITIWGEDRFISVLDRQTGMVVSRGMVLIAISATPLSWRMGRAFGNWKAGAWVFAADFDGSVREHPCDYQYNQERCRGVDSETASMDNASDRITSEHAYDTQTYADAWGTKIKDRHKCDSAPDPVEIADVATMPQLAATRRYKYLRQECDPFTVGDVGTCLMLCTLVVSQA